MKKPRLDARLENLINVLASFRYLLTRHGLSPAEIEVYLLTVLRASGVATLMHKQEAKAQLSAKAVAKCRFSKKAETWSCPETVGTLIGSKKEGA